MIESTLKIARYCPLVIQGFSNFLGLFQGMKWQTPLLIHTTFQAKVVQPLPSPWRLPEPWPGSLDHVAGGSGHVRCQMRCWHASAEGLGPHAGEKPFLCGGFGVVGAVLVKFWDELFCGGGSCLDEMI